MDRDSTVSNHIDTSVRRVLENRFQNRDTTIEEAHLSNLFGAGVMAAYRGPRLYNAEETRTVVARWVAFYKKYRARLDSDIIHIRRADGRDIDGFMHANSHPSVNPGSRRVEVL